MDDLAWKQTTLCSIWDKTTFPQRTISATYFLSSLLSANVLFQLAHFHCLVVYFSSESDGIVHNAGLLDTFIDNRGEAASGNLNKKEIQQQVKYSTPAFFVFFQQVSWF